MGNYRGGGIELLPVVQSMQPSPSVVDHCASASASSPFCSSIFLSSGACLVIRLIGGEVLGEQLPARKKAPDEVMFRLECSLAFIACPKMNAFLVADDGGFLTLYPRRVSVFMYTQFVYLMCAFAFGVMRMTRHCCRALGKGERGTVLSNLKRVVLCSSYLVCLELVSSL